MAHKITIAGREIELEWTQETAKRFAFRLAGIGGMPTQRQFTQPQSAAAAVVKVLWALLPKADFMRYETPEDLFVDIDGEAEHLAIGQAVTAIFSEMAVTPEKKRTSKK